MPFVSSNTAGRKPGFIDDPYSLEPVTRQINNARTRIQDAGFPLEDADGRNWFEKMTNLPEDQNAFFDVLELIGRPGSAIVNAVNESVTGGNALEGAWRGFSGQDRTRGADLVENLGVENPVSKFVLGTAVDIGLDPLTYVPGGVIAKGIQKGAGSVGTAVKAGRDAIETLAPGLKTFRQDTLEPAMETVKDGLGRAFVPDYKLGEDLYGRADDTILNLKQKTENDIAFMNEEAMKGVSDAAKIAGGIDKGADVGRIMEEDLVMTGPRPFRATSTDPNIQQAAKTLMDSNTVLRQWAVDNDVPVGELEGYMTHVLSQAEREARNKVRAMPVDRGNTGTGQPNKKVINERTLQGSVEDINQQMGREFFEPNAFFASAIGQKRLIEFGNAVKFRREVLSNQNFAQEYQKGMPVPKNAVVIDTNNYTFLSNPNNALPDEIGGEYVVTKSVKQALDRYKKLTDDEGINGFLKAYDGLQSGWKRLALFSPGYHIRNDVGAKFNNWVGGMSLVNIAKYSKEADVDVYNAVVKGQEPPMYREFREQGLGSTGLSAVEYARRGMEPEDAIRNTIEKRSKFDGTLGSRVKAEIGDLKKNPLSVFETSRQFGDFIDQTNRFALYKWARDKGMTPEQAAAKVREVQFDYSKTTPFEREVLTRVAPFYRWARNNMPFQIRQFINDPRKYANINATRENAQEAVGIDDENVPEWMKSSFAMPVYGEGGDGKFFSANLPVGDLTKISDPLKLLMDMVTPVAKLPAEVALNRNFFYNKPIEKFEGQEKQFAIPGTDVNFGIDATLAYVLEQLGGQVGRGVSSFLQRPEDADQDTQFRMPTLGISSLVKDFDADKSKYFEGREELQKLMDFLNYIEQQTGERPRTMQEIERGR